MSKVNRRQYMAGVAALAGARWEAEDIDPDDTEPLEGGNYTTGEFTPQRIIATGKSNVAGWTIEDDDVTDRLLEVFYDTEDVNLTIQGESDDVLASELAVLTPHQARQLGAALYQAGEELERRQEVTDADE